MMESQKSEEKILNGWQVPTLNCLISGTTSDNVQWYKDKKPIANVGPDSIYNITKKDKVGDYKFDQTSAVDTTLTVNLAKMGSACLHAQDYNGVYECVGKGTRKIGGKNVQAYEAYTVNIESKS